MITTKLLVPRVNPDLVQRTSLYTKLNTGQKKKLIHISAPPGFGKTSLVSEWINHYGITATWYSLDKRDNDPAIFLNYIITGLKTLDQNIGNRTLDLINAPQRPKIDSLIELLIDDIQKINMDFFFVFDDYHLIDSIEVQHVTRMILQHMPAFMHLVIITRSDISIPLARIRSQNQLLDLRTSDLSFSEQEIASLFNKRLRLGLSQEEVNALLSKTEGWIAGLQLTALSLQNTSDVSGFVRAFAGDNRYIMDYLMEEVLSNQKDDIRDFLLQTSILEQLSGPLCDDLLGRENSQVILESLEKKNMFIVPLDEERKWYRYHHLFADLLKLRALNTPGINVGDLHQGASRWFEKNSMPTLAIDHSMEMKDYPRAIQLLNAEVERLWEEGQHASIIKYGELLPDENLKQSPRFCILYSWTLVSGGLFQEAERILFSAQKKLDEYVSVKEENQENKDLPGKLAVAFAFLYASSGNVGSILKHCSKAIVLVGDDQTTWYSWAWYSSGLGHMMIGNLNESIKAFGRALEAAVKTGNHYLISTIGIRYAFCELQLGNYKTAYRKCQELLGRIRDADYTLMAQNEWSFAGLFTTMGYIEHEWAEGDALQNSKIGYELSCKGNDVTSRVFSTIVYIRVLRYLGDLKKVESLINELDVIERERELFPYLRYTFYAVKLGAYVRFHQMDNASRFVESHHLNPGDDVDENNELLYTSFAWMLLAESRLKEAETLLDRLHSLVETVKRRERLVEINILLAVLQHIQENEVDAMNHLVISLTLAEEEHLIMHFIIEGEHIARSLEMLYRDYQAGNYRFSKKFLGKVLRAIEKKAKQADQASFYSLSKREIEVLRLMAEDLSNKEIADQMFVSLNTVKAHAKNIHLKLEVDSRNKAVAKARELGLL